MTQRIDPEGVRLPVKLDTTSNGEFVPVPLSPANREANRLAHAAATRQCEAPRTHAPRFPRLRLRRGEHAARVQCRERRGRPHRRLLRRPRDAALDLQLAQATVGGKGEFIFDVQGHFVDPNETWLEDRAGRRIQVVAESRLRAGQQSRARAPSRVPRPRGVREGRLPRQRHGHDGAVVRARDARGRAAHDPGGRRGAPHRRPAAGHASAADPRPRQSESARRRRSDGRARRRAGASAAWKTYTQWGPDGNGFFLSDEPGIRFIEKARSARRQERSASTRACRSGSSRTSTASAATSASSRSAFRT